MVRGYKIHEVFRSDCFIRGRAKGIYFFPNSILSEKIEAYMLEAVSRNQNVPPVITKSAPRGKSRKKYLMAIMIIVILIIEYFVCHHNYLPLPSDLGK